MYYFTGALAVMVLALVAVATVRHYQPPNQPQRATNAQPQEMITCFSDGTGVGTGYRDFTGDIKRLCAKSTTGNNSTCVGSSAFCGAIHAGAGSTIIESIPPEGTVAGDGASNCGSGGTAIGAGAKSGC